MSTCVEVGMSLQLSCFRGAFSAEMAWMWHAQVDCLRCDTQLGDCVQGGVFRFGCVLPFDNLMGAAGVLSEILYSSWECAHPPVCVCPLSPDVAVSLFAFVSVMCITGHNLCIIYAYGTGPLYQGKVKYLLWRGHRTLMG